MSSTAAVSDPTGTRTGALGGVTAGVPVVADAAARAIVEDVRRALSRLAEVDPTVLSADGLLRFTADMESLTRVVDNTHIALAAEITERSPRTAGFDGLAARHGCATGAQLIERVTGVSSRTARQRVRVAARTAQRTSDTGLPLPALFPATQRALAGGVIGIDAADAITAMLGTLPHTIPVEAVDWAETTLVNNAIGSDEAPPVCADLIRGQAVTFRDRLDADGIEPRDDRMVAKRGIRFFREADGMLGISGHLPPAQEAIIVPVFDAFLSPRTAPAFLAAEEDTAHDTHDGDAHDGDAHDGAEHGVMRDPRTPEQQRADILTALCEGAARTGQTPQLHGAAPTVLAIVQHSDLDTGTGSGVAAGTDQPLPISTIGQIACDGGSQQVTLDSDGRVIELFSKARFFTPSQRKAMIARDGPTCVKPGCTIPAYWAEAHHIIPDSEGGPTEVGNGCLLCWFDHRLVERGEFTIKMVGGKPVFSPPGWYTKREYLKPHGHA
ncbi:MAG: HNH endonuclease [Microbacteriaceae bacterium]|nr:MAG: HNH endonuclease [Microbacteriaceae bacterium]